MPFKRLKYIVDSSLAQSFKSEVTRSYLHSAILPVAIDSVAYPSLSNGNKVAVYMIILDVVKNPNAISQLDALIKQNFTVKTLNNVCFYIC